MVTVLVADEEVAAERECMVLGSPAPASIDGGFAFHGRPAGLVVDPAGSLYVSDATSRTIRRVGNGGAPAVVAGPASGISGTAGRRVLSPVGLALAGDGSILVADTTGHRIWAVSPAGWLRLVAGSVYGYRNGPGAEAQFRFPSGVAIGPDGTCYVADTGSDRISTITPDGLVATLAGSPPGGDRDGAGVEVGLCWPTGSRSEVTGTSGWPTMATARSVGSTASERVPRTFASPGATGPSPSPERPTER